MKHVYHFFLINSRRGLERLFNGSIAEDLIENTSLPVLTAKIEVE